MGDFVSVDYVVELEILSIGCYTIRGFVSFVYWGIVVFCSVSIYSKLSSERCVFGLL